MCKNNSSILSSQHWEAIYDMLKHMVLINEIGKMVENGRKCRRKLVMIRKRRTETEKSLKWSSVLIQKIWSTNLHPTDLER